MACTFSICGSACLFLQAWGWLCITQHIKRQAKYGSPGVAEEEQEIHHDDLLGEAVCQEEAAVVQQTIMAVLLGEAGAHSHPYFPGSQPVSLARSNMDLLMERRYWVMAL